MKNGILKAIMDSSPEYKEYPEDIPWEPTPNNEEIQNPYDYEYEMTPEEKALLQQHNRDEYYNKDKEDGGIPLSINFSESENYGMPAPVGSSPSSSTEERPQIGSSSIGKMAELSVPSSSAISTSSITVDGRDDTNNTLIGSSASGSPNINEAANESDNVTADGNESVYGTNPDIGSFVNKAGMLNKPKGELEKTKGLDTGDSTRERAVGKLEWIPRGEEANAPEDLKKLIIQKSGKWPHHRHDGAYSILVGDYEQVYINREPFNSFIYKHLQEIPDILKDIH
jgi:hypothetical protein